MANCSSYELIQQFATDHMLPVEGFLVKLNDETSCATAIKRYISSSLRRWEDYCDNGGEGFVFKISPTLDQRDDAGRPLQAVLKARGKVVLQLMYKAYLRLVYGIDYLEADYFERVGRRNIRDKRAVALQQNELSRQILRCWLNRQGILAPYLLEVEKEKLIAAFYGLDASKLDATL